MLRVKESDRSELSRHRRLALMVAPLYLFFGLSHAFRDFDMTVNGQRLVAASGLGGAVAIVAGQLVAQRRPRAGWTLTAFGLVSVPALFFIGAEVL